MPSAAEEAILGAAGSAGACVVSHPLDTARARQALGLGVRAGPSLASGMGVAMAYNVVLNGARFGGLSVSTASGADEGLSGFVAGGLSGYIAAPLARARTLLQTSSSGGGTWHALLGGGGAFAGASAWALRSASHSGVIFAVRARALPAIERAAPEWTPSSIVHLAASLQASLVSCLLVNPLDVVATRLQAAPTAAGGGAPASIVACVLRGGLYGGLAANAARVVPHTCLTFSIVEALRSRLT